MKRLLNALLMLTIGLFAFPYTAAAYDGVYTGTITTMHFNANVPGRGVCVQMNPAINSPSGIYACLPTSNALYKEITAILLTGYATGKSCTLYLIFTTGSLYNEIEIAQCE